MILLSMRRAWFPSIRNSQRPVPSLDRRRIGDRGTGGQGDRGTGGQGDSNS